jgi:hypothetical protein
MKHLIPNVAAVALAVAMPAYAPTSNTKPAARGAPSAAEAKAFVDNSNPSNGFPGVQSGLALLRSDTVFIITVVVLVIVINIRKRTNGRQG